MDREQRVTRITWNGGIHEKLYEIEHRGHQVMSDWKLPVAGLTLVNLPTVTAVRRNESELDVYVQQAGKKERVRVFAGGYQVESVSCLVVTANSLKIRLELAE